MIFFYRIWVFLALSACMQVILSFAETGGTSGYIDTCYRCVDQKKLWVVFERFGLRIRKCVEQIDILKWSNTVANILDTRAKCDRLVGDDRIVAEFPSTWPRTCYDCTSRSELPGVMDNVKEGNQKFRVCFPQEPVKKETDRTDTANLFPECSKVLHKETPSLPTSLPMELESCFKCAKDPKNPLCVAEVLEVKRSYCSDQVPNRPVSLTQEGCRVCVQSNLHWCVKGIDVGKEKSCARREIHEPICTALHCGLLSTGDGGRPSKRGKTCTIKKSSTSNKPLDPCKRG